MSRLKMIDSAKARESISLGTQSGFPVDIRSCDPPPERKAKPVSIPQCPERFFQPLPTWMWAAALLLAGWGSFTNNPDLTPASILILPVLGHLMWFRGEPP